MLEGTEDSLGDLKVSLNTERALREAESLKKQRKYIIVGVITGIYCFSEVIAAVCMHVHRSLSCFSYLTVC